MTKLDAAQRMLTWLAAEGGYVHPSVEARDDAASGLGLYATAAIAADDRLISCPFSLAITPALAAPAIAEVCGVADDAFVHDGERWNERMLAAAYVGLHLLKAGQDDFPAALKHRPYTDTLPAQSTPHTWSDAERALLAGTNLAGAVEKQAAEWQAEAATLRSVLKEEGFTWDLYATLQAHISSRAFPSALLRLPANSTAETTPANEAEIAAANAQSHPVLLPGLDLLNHKRGQAITWLTSRIPSPASPNADVEAISFVSPGQEPGEVFNNYGAKSNESLLLGYGFVIDSNADDTLALQLGGMSPEIVATLEKEGLEAGKRYEVRRDGVLPIELVRTVRVMMADMAGGCGCEGCGGEGEHDHEDGHEQGEGHSHAHDHGDDSDDDDPHAAHEKEVAELELELDVLGMLGNMLEDKLARLENVPEAGEGVRPEVEEMARIYRQGQIDIAAAALEALGERVERVEMLMADGPECPCGC